MQTLLSVLRTTNHVLPLTLSDLTDETARRRTRGDEGPSIAWTVGHLLDYRFKILRLLGDERQSPYTKQFIDTPANDGTGYPTLANFLEQWARVHADLEAVMARSSSDVLDKSLPGGGAHGETKVRDRLAFYVWHEGYHMGTIGAARKALGLPGPAELVAASVA